MWEDESVDPERAICAGEFQSLVHAALNKFLDPKQDGIDAEEASLLRYLREKDFSEPGLPKMKYAEMAKDLGLTDRFAASRAVQKLLEKLGSAWGIHKRDLESRERFEEKLVEYYVFHHLQNEG